MECLHKHISEEEFNRLFDNGDGETYWTTWWEDICLLSWDSGDLKD